MLVRPQLVSRWLATSHSVPLLHHSHLDTLSVTPVILWMAHLILSLLMPKSLNTEDEKRELRITCIQPPLGGTSLTIQPASSFHDARSRKLMTRMHDCFGQRGCFMPIYLGDGAHRYSRSAVNCRVACHESCRANTSGQDSTVYTHLQASGHSFKDEDVHILDREEQWFERGVKESFNVKREQPSLNKGGGLRVHLSSSYNAVIANIPQILCE